MSAPLSLTQEEAPQYPRERENFVDPAPSLLTGPPIGPLKMVGGSTGWLVTGFKEARALLRDPRFSVQRWRGDDTVRPVPQPVRDQQSGDPGNLLTLDPPDHGRYRGLLAGYFTVRRMQALESRVTEIVEECATALEKEGRGADLVRHFALPVPSLVICDLLGGPTADRDVFHWASSQLHDQDVTDAELVEAVYTFIEYLDGLIKARRARPEDDLVSSLTSDSDLTDGEINTIARMLLIAGHEPIASMLGLGTFTLLQNPAQMEKLREDDSLMPGAVEELLRYLSIVNAFPVRIALEDVEFCGVTIEEGQTVAVCVPAANRDTVLADDPHTFDVARTRPRHLAFGYGIHQCLGQHLARVELAASHRVLLRRFPGLALAVPPEEVPMRTDTVLYGVDALPVTW